MIRVFTTILLAVGVLAGIWYLPLFWIQLLLLVALFLGLFEYAKLSFPGRKDRLFFILLGMAFAALVTWKPSMENIFGGIVAVIFLSFLWGFAKKEPPASITASVGSIVLGVLYLGLTIPCWGWIHQIGKEWVMLLLFPACLTDTFGFLVGSGIGKRKLAPVISPNKTWEGFFGSLFGGMFGAWLAAWAFFPSGRFELFVLLGLGLGISLLAIFGDLIESLIKRGAGVKDSSQLIPGHGGALDRLDALIFVAPAFYLLLQSGTIVR